MKLSKQRGVAAVELALIMVPMLVLCFGIIEVGRALYYYDGLVKASRGAARYLTQQDLNDPVSDAYKDAEWKAKSLAVCGRLLARGTSCDVSARRVPGLTETRVTVLVPGTVTVPIGSETGTISLVSVKISGVSFQPMLPYVFGSFASFVFGGTEGITLTMARSI